MCCLIATSACTAIEAFRSSFAMLARVEEEGEVGRGETGLVVVVSVTL